MPPGTYLTSCRGCALDGELLRCTHCPKTCGTRVESSIAVEACAAFGNSGGQLICDAPANGEGIPAGSYTGSCGGCTMDDAGETLTCTHCTGADGAHHSSSLSVHSCGEGEQLGNADGQLACESTEPAADDGGRRQLDELPPNAEGIPEGSYTGSCGGCALEGDSLTCSDCRAADGSVRASSIPVASCNPAISTIGNSDGQLSCEEQAEDAGDAPDETDETDAKEDL